MTVFGFERQSIQWPSWPEACEHLSAIVAVGTLGVVLAADGGRDTATMVPVLLFCLPALLFTTPWRRVPADLLLLLGALPTAAIAVSYATPMGFSYSRDLGVWAYASVLGVAVLSYAQRPGRRLAVLVFVCLLGFYDFFEAFVPWHFKGDPAQPMVGTFYQQDMFGAFCTAVALTAATVAVLGASPWRWIGWVVAPVCVSGAVLSTSRAAEGLLLLGAITLGVVAATGPPRVPRLLAFLSLIALSVGLLFFLTSPLLFPGHGGGSPLSGTSRRLGSDSLGSSSTIRQAYWKAGFREFRDAPLVGEGFGAFGLTFFDRAPLGAFGSRYAHNGFLQGFGEGGLLFGVPLIALGAAVAAAGMRGLAQAKHAFGWDGVSRVAAAFGALALLGHTLVDFDWSFPALAGSLAALASVTPRQRVGAVGSRLLGPAALVLLMAAALFSAYAVHVGLDTRSRLAAAQRLTSAGRIAEAVALVRRSDHSWLPDPSVWSALLPIAAADDAAVRAKLPEAVTEKALTRTSALAELDPHIQFLRATVLVRLGRSDQGLDLARRALAKSSRGRPDLIADYGLLLSTSGDRASAVRVLAAAARERAKPGFPLPDNVWRLVEALQAVVGVDGTAARCAFAEVEKAFGAESRPGVIPIPTEPSPATCST